MRKLSIRTKLILVSGLLLIVPILTLGIVTYRASGNETNALIEKELKNNVKLASEMVNSLNKAVENGSMTKEQAQENLRTVLLGGKQADNTRPINQNIDLGKNGYFFVLDDKGNLLAHPSLEGQNIWDKKTSDGTYYIQNMAKVAQQGGGITYYNWPLPNSKKEALKVTYAEKAPSWGWIIAAGSYMQDYNAGQRNILSTTLITLLVCLAVGITLLTLFANYLTRPIIRIANQAEQMAKGDLTGELIVVSSGDEVGQLAKSINAMTLSLRTTVSGILVSADSVSAAAQQILATTEEIASGSTNQANDAQAMSELFKELSAAINSVAVSAEQAAELSNSTLYIAQDGGKVVGASIEGMNQVNNQMSLLAEDSNKIGDIIEVIGDIAEQTNLLALNAAIEAARAGEQGRGFAVVADEVRKLAERSSEATKQINGIIKGMQENTSKSVKAVGEGVVSSRKTGEAFENIIKVVNDSAQKVTEIAAASEEQAAQSSQVLASIESISAATEEAAASSQESNATAESLAKLAEELKQSVSIFKVN